MVRSVAALWVPYHIAWYTLSHWVIRSFPSRGVKVLHPAQMISLDRQPWGAGVFRLMFTVYRPKKKVRLTFCIATLWDPGISSVEYLLRYIVSAIQHPRMSRSNTMSGTAISFIAHLGPTICMIYSHFMMRSFMPIFSRSCMYCMI